MRTHGAEPRWQLHRVFLRPNDRPPLPITVEKLQGVFISPEELYAELEQIGKLFSCSALISTDIR